MKQKNMPIYVKIHDEIRQKIENETFRVGSRLPSERTLSETFHVSRMTLRQAIQSLADEGILERRVGSGTYVAQRKVQEKMSGVVSFSEIMKSQGKKPSSKTVAYYVVKPTANEMKKLKISENSEIVRMERIRFADKRPICFEIASIPMKFLTGFSRQEITSHFYQTLSSNGYTIAKSEQTITAIPANGRIADFLGIKKGEALLRLNQVSFLSTNEPFEYVRSQYVGSRFEFFVEK